MKWMDNYGIWAGIIVRVSSVCNAVGFFQRLDLKKIRSQIEFVDYQSLLDSGSCE